jgi:hypothetical protein
MVACIKISTAQTLLTDITLTSSPPHQNKKLNHQTKYVHPPSTGSVSKRREMKERDRTSDDENGVSHRVNHSLQGGHPGHPPMEIVVRPKVPAREPHDDVVPHAKQPDEREVGEGYNARSVRHKPEELVRHGRVAKQRQSADRVHQMQRGCTHYMLPGKTRYPCMLVKMFSATNSPMVMDCTLGGTVPHGP